jgi:hypothetical protein
MDVDCEPFAAGVHRAGEAAWDRCTLRQAFEQHLGFSMISSAGVGWVERSETRRPAAIDGFRVAQPILRAWFME